MRTKCPECKAEHLIVTRDYVQISTVTTRVARSTWGFLIDHAGEVDTQDDEEIEREEIENETEDGDDERTYVQCSECDHVLVNHPLSTIDQDEADEIEAESAKKKMEHETGKKVA